MKGVGADGHDTGSILAEKDTGCWRFRTGLLFILLFTSTLCSAQFLAPSDTLNKGRVWLVSGIGLGGYAIGMAGLNALWYADFPREGFHFYNDNDQWLQMDKAGHAISAYQVTRYSYEALRWAGVEEKKSIWLGAGYSFLWLTTVEVLDGFSAEWGFSTGDMVANVAGSALFVAQQLRWKEQRIALKFSYSPSEFAQYRPDVLGSTGLERVLKDYNGQTAWLSVNMSRFGKRDDAKLPWLSVALGYGANGMLGGSSNPAFDNSGELLPHFDRYRQFYLSLDVDLSRIKTNSHVLKTLFSVVGFIKVPAPALEFSQGNVTWHWIHF
jgi:hypothetical protein